METSGPSLTSPVVQSHEGCVQEVNAARSTGHPRWSLTAAQDQAQLQCRQRAGHPIPQHIGISVLQSPGSRPFSWWMPPGRKGRPPHVFQAGNSDTALFHILEKQQQIYSQLHRVALWPRAVPEGRERQQGYDQAWLSQRSHNCLASLKGFGTDMENLRRSKALGKRGPLPCR